MKRHNLILLTAVSFAAFTNIAFSAEKYLGGIHAKSQKDILAPFDIVHAKITTKDNVATFHMAVAANAGENKPAATGKLAGSNVFSYVWPTSIDSYDVGFEKEPKGSDSIDFLGLLM